MNTKFALARIQAIILFAAMIYANAALSADKEAQKTPAGAGRAMTKCELKAQAYEPKDRDEAIAACVTKSKR